MGSVTWTHRDTHTDTSVILAVAIRAGVPNTSIAIDQSIAEVVIVDPMVLCGPVLPSSVSV